MARNFRSQNLRDFIKTTRGKSYTVAAVTTFLVLGLFLFAVFPATSSIFAQVRENDERELALRQIEAKRQTIRDLLSFEQQNRVNTVALSMSLPDDLQQSTILEDIQILAASSGVQVANLRFTGIESSRSNFDEFEIDSDVLDGKVVNIGVDGSRTQIQNFVTALEASRRVFNIQNLSISRREQDSTSPIFRINIQAEVYFWNLEKLSE
jgi:Tfp pilus assembly protein PilO